MDQLSAHLDRGWDLVQKGDFKGARASARRALETDKNSADAHNLLGFVAAQEGDADEALEHYRQAMALDDGYIDPMLNAAEVLIHPLHELDEAIALCDEVLEFAEGREEIADAVLLKFDALLAGGDRTAARRVLDSLPEGPFEGATHSFLIGRALFEAGDATKAEPHLRAALEADARNPDAHYYMALVLETKSDLRGATLEFLETRELDLRTNGAPWSPPRDAFQKTVERALGQLDASLVEHMAEALVLVSDAPGMEVIADGVDPRVPVLLEGIAPTGEPGPLASRVFVYQRNLERVCAGIEQLEDELVFQLTEEIRHALEHRDEVAAPRAAGDSKPAPRPPAPAEGGRERAAGKRGERDKPADSDEPSAPKKRSRKS
jgi:Flp pilus assembly protein TadD/predicted Zn-dependent protease with MMP-like domain